MDNLLSLHEDNWGTIFSYLTNSERLNCALVCQRWHQIIQKFQLLKRPLNPTSSSFSFSTNLEPPVDSTSDVVKLDTLSQLIRLAELGDVTALQALLPIQAPPHRDQKQFYQELKRAQGEALHVIARYGHLTALQCLYKYVHIDQRRNGKTPLHTAIAAGQDQVVEALLDNGASAKSTLQQGVLKLSPLAFAMQRGEKECVVALIKRSKHPFNYYIGMIGNVLHLTVHFQQTEILDQLLHDYATETKTLIDQPNTDGHTPLSLAAALGNLEAIQLLSQHSADLTCCDAKLRTPMHHAAKANHLDAIELLFCLGAKVNPIDSKGKLPLQLATDPQVQALLRNLINKKRHDKAALPNFSQRPPENLVFKGGGPKGLAYIGALQALEEKGALGKLYRVAGTSAGAITATLIALGYTSSETQTLLANKPLTDFLDHPLKREKVKAQLKKQANISTLWKVCQWIGQPQKLLTLPAILLKKLWHTTGACDGTDFRNWIEDQIYVKTKIHNCTFKELDHLIAADRNHQFKELHVFGTKIGQNPAIVHFSSEGYPDLIISDAVAISMSIPGVFKPRYLYFKDKQDKRFPRPDLGSFVDGGLLSNFPLECFDERRYVKSGTDSRLPVFNRRTLGFSLYSPTPPKVDQPIETIGQLLQAVVGTYLDSETLIRQKTPCNQHRVIEINNQGVGTLDFNLSSKQQQKLINSGHRATADFFTTPVSSDLFQLPRSNGSGPTVALPSQHPHFVGRMYDLQALADTLVTTDNDTEAVIALIGGVPGMGKSELACSFANRHRKHFSLVCRILSETPETRYLAYRHLADALKLHLPNPTPEELERALFHRLENHTYKKPWLLIFDNVETEQAYPQRGGNILITARSHDVITPHLSLPLEPFSQDETTALLIKSANCPPEAAQQGAARLLKALGGSPLILSQAAALIKESTIENYLADLNEIEKTYLLQRKGNSRYKLSIQAAWELSFQRLQAKEPQTLEWLHLCTYWHPEEIPQSWLTLWYQEHHNLSPPEARVQAHDLMRLLCQYDIVHRDQNSFSLHRHLQEVLCTTQAEPHHYLQAAANFLSKRLQAFDAKKPDSWAMGITCLPHLVKLLTHSQDLKPFQSGDLYYTLGKLEETLAKYPQALSAYKKALTSYRQEYGDQPHPSAAISLDSIGFVLQRQGAYEEALKFHQQALDMRRKIYGDQPDLGMLISFHSISSVLESQGAYEEALKFHQQALDMERKVYGDQPHPNMATLNKIGDVLDSQGDYEEALKVHQQVLDMHRKLHGNQPHPDVAGSLNKIGSVLQRQGDYEEALKFHQQALDMERKVYGNQPHPNVAMSLSYIGDVLDSQGDYEEALKAHQQVLDMHRKLHGNQPHPDVAGSLNKVGSVLKNQGAYEEALKLHHQALDMHRKVYGDQPHPNVAMSLSYIGTILKNQKSYDEALKFLHQALDIHRKVYGNDSHPFVAKSLNWIGSVLNSQRDYEEALKFHHQALDIFRKVHGDQPHPDVADSLNYISFVLKNQGSYDEALDFYQQTLEVERKMHSDQSHPNIARLLNNIGFMLLEQGAYDKALKSFKQALDMFRKVYGDQPHPNVAHALNNIGHTLKAQGHRKQALKFYHEVLDMHRKLHGNQPHPNIASLLNNIGTVLQREEAYDEALKFYHEALDTYRKMYGNQPHPNIASLLNNIGTVLQCEEAYDEALKFHHEALDMYRKVYGDQPNPNVASSLNHIGNTLQDQVFYEGFQKAIQQARDKRRKVYGDQPHPNQPNSVNSIDNVFKNQDAHEEALKCYHNALDIYRKVHGDQPHSDVAQSLNNIGNALKRQGDYDEALRFLQQALNMNRRVYGDQPRRFLAGSLNNIGTVLDYQGDYEEALNFYQQALDMYRKIYSNDSHPFVAGVLDRITAVEKKVKQSAIPDKTQVVEEEFVKIIPLIDHASDSTRTTKRSCIVQ